MKLNMLVVLATGLLLGADAPRDDQAIKEVEKAIAALNDAFHTGDADKVKALMTEDHVAVTSYYGGPVDKAGQLKSLSDHQLTEYSPGKLKVTLLGKDSALVTYPLSQKGTYKGKEVAAKSFASAVWVRRGGRWLEAFYQETPLAEK
jgi:ketosteroid isomerase-like protein